MTTNQTTLCLGHDVHVDKQTCPKADICQRHVALRARNFPHGVGITGAACSSHDYVFFMPLTARA